MAGRVQWEAQVDSNVAKLLSETKELRDQLDGIKKGNYEIKLNIDDKKLEKVISNLDKMLESLGRGTGDFKEFENLSKQLNEIVSEVKELNKAFGGINNSGVSNLLSSIQSIDKSLSSLSEHITNVNKDFGSVGKNASDNVGQINEAKKATEGLTEATRELANAQKNVGNKSNILSGNSVEKNTQNTTNAIIEENNALKELILSWVEAQKIMTKSKVANSEKVAVANLNSGFVSNSNITGDLNSISGKLIQNIITSVKEKVDTMIHSHPDYNLAAFSPEDIASSIIQFALGIQNQIIVGMDEISVMDVSKIKNINPLDIKEKIEQEFSDLVNSYVKNQLQNIDGLQSVFNNTFENGIYEWETLTELISENTDSDLLKNVIQKYKDSISDSLIYMSSDYKFNDSDDIGSYIYENCIKKYVRSYIAESNPDVNQSDYDALQKEALENFKKEFIDIYNKIFSFEDYKSLLTDNEVQPIIKQAFSNILESFGLKYADVIKTISVSQLTNSKDIPSLISSTPTKDTFQGGHSDNSEASGVKQYKKKGYKAHDTGNHDNERKVANKKELSRVLKELQTEIIASIDESTQFVKEVTDFYDSQDNLVKTQMKIGDKNGSMSTYTTSYSTDKEGNSTAWTSHITTEKVAEKTKQASKEIQAEWDKNVKAIQEYMDANTKLNNLKAQDAGTGKKSKEIEYNVKKVEELEKAAIEARAILSSMINPHEAPIDDWNKWLDVMKQFDQATVGSAESLAKLEDSLRNMAESQFKKVTDTLSNSEKYLGLLKPTEGNRSVKFEGLVQEYDKAVNSLKEFHATLNATTPLTQEQSNKFEKLANDVKKARIEIDKIPKAQRGSDEDARTKEIDKLTKYLDANTRISKKARQELEHYLDTLKSGDPSVSVKELHTAWTKVAVAEREAGREGKRFFDIISDKALYGQAAQLAGYYLSLTDFIRYGQEGIQVVRELDTALTEMRKVSDETVSSLERFQDVSFDLADNVGTTAKQIQNSTADWMRLGEAMNEASESAQVSNILLNVSEFENIDEATESLVAMSQAYKDLEKIEIVDVLNKIGNEYSISTDGIATALQDSASALVTANNDLNEAVALITAGNAVTQDPNSVGTGMRTISLRLVGTEEAKAELEKLGEDVSDMVMTSSKVRETIMNATKAASKDGVGFDILDNNGNYKSTYEIMQGLADLYDEIVAKDKEFGTNNLNLLLETISGKNRANIAASILQNGDMLRDVFEDAQNADGSAQEELDKYLESIDGRMAKLESQAQEFWYKLIDSDTIKNGITLLTELLGLATDFVDTFGMLGTIGIGAGAFAGIKSVDYLKMPVCPHHI